MRNACQSAAIKRTIIFAMRYINRLTPLHVLVILEALSKGKIKSIIRLIDLVNVFLHRSSPRAERLVSRAGCRATPGFFCASTLWRVATPRS